MRAHGARIERWKALYAGQRPFVYQVECPFDERPMPSPRLDNTNERIDAIKSAYDRQMARAEWLPDDRLPSLNMLTGTDIFAMAFGCTVHYLDDNMPFALPLVHNAAEAAKVRVPDLSNCPVTYLFDMADKLVEYAGKDALVRLVDVQSPMDIAALIWDKNDFYAAMLDTPEAVKELADKVYTFLTAFLDAWFGRYGAVFIAHYPYYYMDGGLTLSEDEIGAVSTTLFNDMFLPELNALSQRYGGIGIHCCADARHQWKGLLSVDGLRAINLVNKPRIIAESLDVFSGVVQMPMPGGDNVTYNRPDTFSPGMRAVLCPSASNKDDALRIAESLENLT